MLGARWSPTIGNRSFRHYFFEIGPESTVAFFEYADPESEPFAKPAGIPDPRAPSSTTCRSTWPTRRPCSPSGHRLKDAGCEVTDVVDHGFVRSIYFTDPNGIALEASWWVIDATGRRPDYADTGSSPTPTRCRRWPSSGPTGP